MAFPFGALAVLVHPCCIPMWSCCCHVDSYSLSDSELTCRAANDTNGWQSLKRQIASSYSCKPCNCPLELQIIPFHSTHIAHTELSEFIKSLSILSYSYFGQGRAIKPSEGSSIPLANGLVQLWQANLSTQWNRRVLCFHIFNSIWPSSLPEYFLYAACA